MEISFLEKFRQFDRNDPEQQLELWGYSSIDLIATIAEDNIIDEPVELTIYNGKALLTDGNHRVSCAVVNGILETPCRIIFKGRLNNKLNKIWAKAKEL